MNTPKTVPSREQRRFLRMMNDSLQGRMSPHEALLVKEHTPEILQRHGLPDLPMLYTQNHLRLAVKPKSKETPRNQHGLTKEILARIPEALETPAVIMRSASKSGRIVCLLSLVDTDGLPILVAIQPNGRGNHRVKGQIVCLGGLVPCVVVGGGVVEFVPGDCVASSGETSLGDV